MRKSDSCTKVCKTQHLSLRESMRGPPGCHHITTRPASPENRAQSAAIVAVVGLDTPAETQHLRPRFFFSFQMGEAGITYFKSGCIVNT